MSKFIEDFKVVRKKRLNEDYFILDLYTKQKLPEILAGQFVEILVEGSNTTFLRRPFSIHDVDYENNILRIYIKIAGDGTKQLSYLEEGDFVNVMYPLGKGFTLPKNNNVLLIGGGCGVAPLLYLSRILDSEGVTPDIIIGGRTKNDIFEIDEYNKYANVYISTEDGSLGDKGFVTQHSLFRENVNKYEYIYTCGPEPMMKAIARIAREYDVKCEVSLENTMACGIGACLCCVVKTTEGHICTCTEGPVFDSKLLNW